MKIVVFLQNSLFHDDFDAESDNVASSAETMRARAAYISAVSTSKVIEALFGMYVSITTVLELKSNDRMRRC